MDLLLVAASAAFAALLGLGNHGSGSDTAVAIATADITCTVTGHAAGTASFAAIAAGGLGADSLGSGRWAAVGLGSHGRSCHANTTICTAFTTNITTITTGHSSLGCTLARTRAGGIEHVACGHGGYSSNNDREFR